MKMFRFNSRHGTFIGCIVKETYLNSGLALRLVDVEGPIATITINLEGDTLPEGQVYIKDYSENQGMLKSLFDAGLVKSVIGHKQSGFVIIPRVELDLEKLKEYTG